MIIAGGARILEKIERVRRRRVPPPAGAAPLDWPLMLLRVP